MRVLPEVTTSMWQHRRFDSAMDSPLGIARPWTPPDTDADLSPRADHYFADAYRSSHAEYSPATEHRWANTDEPTTMGTRCDTPTEEHQARPKPVSIATAPAPFTPKKSHGLDNAHGHGIPQYPYTPDSSRILRRSTELLPSPIPWDNYSEHSSSPVQDALSSCIAHFENLIQTRQPDEDQMEYIVGQFEAMASYLSAPDAQTRGTDEHLFTDHDQGLGIAKALDELILDTDLEAEASQVNADYAAEVERYIAGVRKYIEDLKMRMDEVKTLNSIQLDVIQDLRSQMKTVQQGMQSSLSLRKEYDQAEEEESVNSDTTEQRRYADADEQEEFGIQSWQTLVNDDQPPPQTTTTTAAPKPKERHVTFEDLDEDTLKSAPRRRVITIVHKPSRSSFWSSLGEALDSFGALFLES